MFNLISVETTEAFEAVAAALGFARAEDLAVALLIIVVGLLLLGIVYLIGLLLHTEQPAPENQAVGSGGYGIGIGGVKNVR